MSDYPANDAAFRHVLDTVAHTGATTIIEAGIGNGNAIATWHQAGLHISGFDVLDGCVQQAKMRMRDLDLDPTAVVQADARDAGDLSTVHLAGKADICVAMGVAPHCENVPDLVGNLLALVRPGGTVFIEFRNSLFSLFTFNRYTYDFIMDELLLESSPAIRNQVSIELSKHLAMDTPSTPAPQSQFHNPLTISEELAVTGAWDTDVIPFHYHAGMPLIAGQNNSEFLEASWDQESRAPDWRSLFLCSAFLFKATRPAR